MQINALTHVQCYDHKNKMGTLVWMFEMVMNQEYIVVTLIYERIIYHDNP